MSKLILRETPLKNLKLINHLPVKDDRVFLVDYFVKKL